MAIERGWLRAQKGADGQWLSTRAWLDHYLASRPSRWGRDVNALVRHPPDEALAQDIDSVRQLLEIDDRNLSRGTPDTP